jgi:hypothetical protein
MSATRHASFLADFLANWAVAFLICPLMLQNCAFRYFGPIKGWEGLLGHIEEIVRRGRVRGFIPWLITQRPAVVHKDVFSQADILIAMKLTESQDRDAIGAWIEGQADRQKGKRLLDAAKAICGHPATAASAASSFPRSVRSTVRARQNAARDWHRARLPKWTSRRSQRRLPQ